jgi:DNA invertase Pin-like site-specific DNA recombinase
MEKNVVAYYRTSSQSNVGGDKDSLKRQQNSVITYTKSNGMNVVKWFYDKGVSGSTDVFSRGSFFEMMNYCKDNSIDTIVVENADRLARDLITMETAFMYLTSKLGYNLISVANPETFVENTPTQTIIRQILGAISQFEKSQIVEKLRGARERKSKLNKSRGYVSRNGKGKVEGRKFLTEKHPELFELVVSYRKQIDRKTKKPLSYMSISKLLKDNHNISISYNTVNRILDDVVRIKREERNRKRRKLVA